MKLGVFEKRSVVGDIKFGNPCGLFGT